MVITAHQAQYRQSLHCTIAEPVQNAQLARVRILQLQITNALQDITRIKTSGMPASLVLKATTVHRVQLTSQRIPVQLAITAPPAPQALLNTLVPLVLITTSRREQALETVSLAIREKNATLH